MREEIKKAGGEANERKQEQEHLALSCASIEEMVTTQSCGAVVAATLFLVIGSRQENPVRRDGGSVPSC